MIDKNNMLKNKLAWDWHYSLLVIKRLENYYTILKRILRIELKEWKVIAI